jgi:branched-chain amino acid transport system substrate-binding protein
MAALTACLVVAGLVVASGSVVSSAATRQGDPAPVKIGLDGEFTGPFASSSYAVRPALEAWAKYVNAHGGLNGHRVDLIVMNNQSNLTTAVSNIHTLISQDHVAVLFGGAGFGLQWGNYAAQHNVPVIDDTSSAIASVVNPDFFTPGQTIDSVPAAVALAAKKVGAKKMALFYCAESADCSQLVPLERTAATKAGVPLVYYVSISATAPSYIAPCLAAKQAGAKALFIGDTLSVLLTVAKSCSQQGYKPSLIADGPAVGPSFATAPGWSNGMISMQPDIPFSVKDTPATKVMYGAFDKYEPGFVHNPDFSEIAVSAWAAGMLLQAAAKAGKLGVKGPPTAAEIYNGLYSPSLQGATLGGISPPLHFTKGHPHLTHCWFWMRTKNGKFTTPYGLKAVCANLSAA